MLKLFNEKKIWSMVSKVIEFEEVKDWLIKMRDEHCRGRIVAKITPKHQEY